MPSKETINQFGKYDYERLMEDNKDEYMKRLSPIPDDLKDIAEKLKKLINSGRLHIMDKESGVAFSASVVIGFDGYGLLIANER